MRDVGRVVWPISSDGAGLFFLIIVPPPPPHTHLKVLNPVSICWSTANDTSPPMYVVRSAKQYMFTSSRRRFTETRRWSKL